MKQNLTLFSLSLFLLFISCVHKTGTTESTMLKSIDLRGSLHNIDTSYMDSIEYIPLKASKPLGEIRKLIIAKQGVYCFDEKQQKAITIFDHKGNFTGLVKAVGKGKGEYINPRDMDVDVDGNVWVYQRGLSSKLLKFKPTGEFEKEIKTKVKANYFSLCGMDEVLWFNVYKPYNGICVKTSLQGNSDSVLIPNHRGKYIQCLYDYTLIKNRMDQSHLIFSYLNDTIYQYANNELNSLFEVKRNIPLTDEFILPLFNNCDAIRQENFTGRSLNFNHICVSTNYVYFEITEKGKTFGVNYSKKTGKVILSKGPNDRRFTGSQFRTAYGDYFYSLITPFGMYDKARWSEFVQNHPDFDNQKKQEMMEAFENDLSILVKVKLKDF